MTHAHTKISANPLYAAAQLAKVEQTQTQHPDAATRERASKKILKWQAILNQMHTGSAAYGSRTPLKNTPAWVTLEVATGGFATGTLLAAGDLQEHELALIKALKLESATEPRLALNQYFISPAGLTQLNDYLASGQYELNVPEEGALLVLACLIEHNYLEQAQELLATLQPFFAQLRFYPKPAAQARSASGLVAVQTVGQTIQALEALKPQKRILAQQEAVLVWIPFHDRVVALMLETMQNDWPCRSYPTNWRERAQSLLNDYQQLAKQHTRCQKHADPKAYPAQLREFMRRCIATPEKLTGLEVSRIRYILTSYLAKYGYPASESHQAVRAEQATSISKPTFKQIADVVIKRLETQNPQRGLEQLVPFIAPITSVEEQLPLLPAEFPIPASLQDKVARCRIDSLAALVEDGLISSAEVVAQVLPQLTSSLQAANLADDRLRALYAALYQTFRKRRSLLLFNLEKQVQMHELPWIASLDSFRRQPLSQAELARQTLVEVVSLVLMAFPQTIIPNKLLQELRALINTAGLMIPLVDELAADIFMGAFSEKFTEATLTAAQLLRHSLYASYYEIDYRQISADLSQTSVSIEQKVPHKTKFKLLKQKPSTLADLCATRAGVPLRSWQLALNGMVIEQQQILSTQNLAALWLGLNLEHYLANDLRKMAQDCFVWICKEQQIKRHDWHSLLIMKKNTAYAWRQMLFFVSLLPSDQQHAFLHFAKHHLAMQDYLFRKSFQPILKGLAQALAKAPIETEQSKRFLGWTKNSKLT